MDYSGSDNAPPQAAERDRYVASYPPEELNTEFKRKYPPDPFGEEMSANARVWKVYKDEATAHDKSLLDGWNKTLDILLIFAGLFSAVATAFVIESYKLLQPDYEEYIAGALFAALTSRNGSGTVDRVLDLPNPNDFAPLGTSRWLNGIWFTSLVLSLIVAFLCILLKQCIEEYTSRVSAPFPSLRHWSRRRTFFYDGMTDWAVPMFIAILPLLLHAAVFLFLAGLSILLWTLDVASAAWILTVTNSVLLFYVGSILVPFIWPNCPASTPLPRILRRRFKLVRLRLSAIVSTLAVRTGAPAQHSGRPSSGPSIARVSYWLLHAGHRLVDLFRSSIWCLLPATIRSRLVILRWRLKRRFVSIRSRIAASPPGFVALSQTQRDKMDAHVLAWLLTACPSVDVAIVGFRAIGSLSPWSSAIATLRCAEDLRGSIERCLATIYGHSLPIPHGILSEADIARDLRSLLSLWGPAETLRVMARFDPLSLYGTISDSPHYDLPFISDALTSALRLQSCTPSLFVSRLKQTYSTYLRRTSPAPVLSLSPLPILSFPDLPLQTRLQLCRLICLRPIPLRDFFCMVTGFLPHLNYTSCPLEQGHSGSSCRVQCAYELFSEIATRSPSLGLDIEDAHCALDIILKHASINSVELADFWAPLQSSHFLQLLGSDVFVSHVGHTLVRSLCPLARQLRAMGHCLQRRRGLPLWTSEWGCAIQSMLSVTTRFQLQLGHELYLVLQHTCSAILRMFDVEYSDLHVSILAEDDTSRLPLQLLRGSPTSSWEMLTALSSTQQPLQLDPLADLLAASLCTAARLGMDVDVEFKTFVDAAGFYIMQRIRKVMRYNAGSSAKRRIFALVRHCDEVHEGWFHAFHADRLPPNDVPEDAPLHHFLQVIEVEAFKLGPCRECPSRTKPTAKKALRSARAAPIAYMNIRLTFEEERARWLVDHSSLGSNAELDVQ